LHGGQHENKSCSDNAVLYSFQHNKNEATFCLFQVIFGPMFSGKSTELMRRVRRFQIAQYKCIVIKYAKDIRYSKEQMATHDRHTMSAVSACCLADVFTEALNCCVIGIDEGQFVSSALDFSVAICTIFTVPADFNRYIDLQAFGDILNLVPLAESVVKLNAVCMICYREASYTKRLGAEKEVSPGIYQNWGFQVQICKSYDCLFQVNRAILPGNWHSPS
ncbi:thymidine kinase, cytosolic, partial [Pyxicephalus adspersus]|uniref:thymidine kinase, cytosolic n=1 Tax=Pyxicephalus adspersus TaxID=30357 RepID=UPI003B5BF68B